MPSASSPNTPFKVPLGLDVISRRRLKGTALLEFYKLNKDDFFAALAVLYFEAVNDPKPGHLLDAEKGFDSFCDLVTEYLLAAPSETFVSAKDEDGQFVNFFGEAIVDHLEDPSVSSQQLYAYDGSEKHPIAWLLVNNFIRYVAIESFRGGLGWLGEQDIVFQRYRITELQEGKRKLIYVPKVQRRLFH